MRSRSQLRRRVRIVSIIAVALLSVTSCGDSDDDSGGGSAGNGSSRDENISVLSEGSNPRSKLRFDLAPGNTFRAAMTMKIGWEMSVNGEALPPTQIPAIQTLIAGKIDSVNPSGTAEFTYSFEEMKVVGDSVDPATAQQIQGTLDQMKGFTGSASIDDRGNTSNSRADTSAITDPTMKTTLESFTSQVSNLTVPFPEEAVGKGAQWRAKRSAVLNGVTTDMATTYTVRSLTSKTYELDVVQKLTAPTGPAQLPGLPAGASISIVSYLVDSRGSVSGDLGSLLPSSSKVTGEGDIKMTFRQGTESGDILQHLMIDISLAAA